MKLLLDEGLPRRAATQLRAADIDASHVYDAGLGGATDAALLEYARQDASIVVCFDSDFHRLLALTQATAPSVIRLRVEEMDHVALAKLIRRVVTQTHDVLETGAAVTVTMQRVRIHHLPIG